MTSEHKPNQVLPLVLSPLQQPSVRCYRELAALCFLRGHISDASVPLTNGIFFLRVILIILDFPPDVDLRMYLTTAAPLGASLPCQAVNEQRGQRQLRLGFWVVLLISLRWADLVLLGIWGK